MAAAIILDMAFVKYFCMVPDAGRQTPPPILRIIFLNFWNFLRWPRRTSPNIFFPDFERRYPNLNTILSDTL